MSLQGFGDTPIDDVLPTRAPSPEEKVEQNERVGYLVDAVAELPERLRVVVESYFFGERPMAEIADELGVTESRVSQMRAEALVLLKDAMNSALDPELVKPAERPDGCAARRRDAYFAAVASRRTATARLSMSAAFDRSA
jgi:RNA polymerase sigma factor FliA